MTRFVCSALAAFASVASLAAQEQVAPITFHFGAGFTQGVGHTGRDIDTGWGVLIGGGYNFNRFVAGTINFSTNVFRVATTIPSNFGVEGGNVTIFSATFDPVVHVVPRGPVDVYITGGAGLYRKGFTPLGPAGNNPIPAYYSVNKPGADFGVGLAFKTRGRGKIFAEARYNHIYDNSRDFADYIPVTFGFRW